MVNNNERNNRNERNNNQRQAQRNNRQNNNVELDASLNTEFAEENDVQEVERRDNENADC